MTILPPAEMRALRETITEETSSRHNAAGATIAARWDGLHACAADIARMAGIAAEKPDDAVRRFIDRFEAASEWQRTMASQGIDDIAAMLRPGLAALNTIVQRGGDTSAAALALWHEFHHARSAVLALVEPRETAEAA